MVVVVILVTLVAGVLPLVSPNNDARKIAEAARGLRTYFMQAQAEAARTGRPVGVGFRETSLDSNVAIEAFQLAVPEKFAGFSENSRTQVKRTTATYGPGGNEGAKFKTHHKGKPLYALQFVHVPHALGESGTLVPNREEFPANMLKVGDTVNLEGNEFLIVDDDSNTNDINDFDEDTGFLLPDEEIYCVWLNDLGQQLETIDPASTGAAGIARAYKVFRQPAAGDKFGSSSEAVYQFPSGVAVDMQGSGFEGGAYPSLFARGFNRSHIGIMFSPHGDLEGVYFTGIALGENSYFLTGSETVTLGPKITDASRVSLLVGKVENGTPSEWLIDQSASDDQWQALQERVNWLNPDSRWLMVESNGRTHVEPVARFDAREPQYNDENFLLTTLLQVEAARGGAP